MPHPQSPEPEGPFGSLAGVYGPPGISQFDLNPPSTPPRPRLGRVWVNILLFLVTLLTTSAVGARMQFNFEHNLPAFEADRDLDAFWVWWSNPEILASGLTFSLPLLAILMAHECGHYVACVYYGIDATLPFFLPAPTFTGTMGAFIRIRSPIFSRRQLFDIGIAGPVAGFILLLPVAGVGIAFSKVIPGIGNLGSWHFGTPAFLRLLEWAVFPHVGAQDIYLHPVARAAWVGMFATALNLIPAGQLDGGHIIYALFGRVHKWVTRVAMIVLAVLGMIFWTGWVFWAVVLLLFARKHPPIYDLSSVGVSRWKLGAAALALFLLCFTLSPLNQ